MMIVGRLIFISILFNLVDSSIKFPRSLTKKNCLNVVDSKYLLTIVTAVSCFSIINPVLCASAASEVPLYGLKKDRLLPCKAQSNCVSTSSINSLEKYSRPWSFSQSPDEAWKSLVNALTSSEFFNIVEQDNEKYYIRCTAKSALPPLGIDDIEFLLNPRDQIVTFRSNSRELVYAGVQLVGDGGSNKNRLETIKRKLGWKDMGEEVETSEYLKEVSNAGFIKRMQMASQPSDINFVDNSVPLTVPVEAQE